MPTAQCAVLDVALLADNGYGLTKSFKETEKCTARTTKSKAKMQNTSNVSQPQETCVVVT